MINYLENANRFRETLRAKSSSTARKSIITDANEQSIVLLGQKGRAFFKMYFHSETHESTEIFEVPMFSSCMIASIPGWFLSICLPY